MAGKQYKRASLKDVLVLTLRMSVFHSTPPPLLTEEKWNAITGTEVDNFVRSKSKGEIRADALFGAGILQCRQTNQRTDWLYTPPTRFEELPSTTPSIGSIVDVLEPFLKVANAWLEHEEAIVKRLALGIIAIIPSDSTEEAFDRLAPYLPAVQIDPEHTHDFLYQINRRRASQTVEGLTINRLTKWSVATLGLDIETSAGPAEHNYPLAFVELDINTDANYENPLEREQQTRLLAELAELAKEIISEGDVQ